MAFTQGTRAWFKVLWLKQDWHSARLRIGTQAVDLGSVEHVRQLALINKDTADKLEILVDRHIPQGRCELDLAFNEALDPRSRSRSPHRSGTPEEQDPQAT